MKNSNIQKISLAELAVEVITPPPHGIIIVHGLQDAEWEEFIHTLRLLTENDERWTGLIAIALPANVTLDMLTDAQLDAVGLCRKEQP